MTDAWEKLLPILSLERTLPLYGAMGVPGNDPAVLQRQIREVLRPQTSEHGLGDKSSWLEMLRERLGTAQLTVFLQWAEGVYLGYHADQPEWSAWQIAFSQFAYSHRGKIDFLKAEKREIFLTGYRERVEIDDIKNINTTLAKLPLSAWDLDVFSAQGYGASWESGPLAVVEPLIEVERLKQFAREFWIALEPTEREELQRRAQALLQELRVWMPGPLADLGVLLRAA